MSYYAADTTGYLQDIASLGGWRRFVEWAAPMEGVIGSFIQKGMTDDPNALVKALDLLEGPDASVESTRRELLSAAQDATDVLIITDGASDDALRVAGGEGSGNFGHAGRPGEVGGSADAVATVSPPATAAERTWDGESTFTKVKGERPYYAYQRQIVGQKYGFFVSVRATPKAAERIKATLDKLPAPFLTDLDTHGGIESDHKVREIGGVTAVGSYRAGAGEVWARSDTDLENTLVHELGHAYYKYHYPEIEARTAWREDVGKATTFGGERGKPASESQLRRYKYYAGNSEEAIVEAMAHILHPSSKSESYRKAFPRTVKAVEESFRKLGVIK